MLKARMLHLVIATVCIVAPTAWSMVAVAQPRDFHIAEGSSVRFRTIGKEVTVPAEGRFAVVGGRMLVDPANVKGARGDVEVVLSSVTTEDAGWDAAFRTAEFLGITEHPRARFDLQSIRSNGPLSSEWAPLELVGNFTLHGVTRKLVAKAVGRYVSATSHTRERIRARAVFRLLWDAFEIPVPKGSTRAFAGDGVDVSADLVFEALPPSSNARTPTKGK